MMRFRWAVQLLMVLALAGMGCAPDDPLPDPGSRPSPGPAAGVVSPAEFGEQLARAIEAGTWTSTDEFFTSAAKAAKACNLDPKILDTAFGPVGERRPLDQAAFAAKARSIH